MSKIDTTDLTTDYTKLTASGRRVLREKYSERQGGLCMFCEQPLYEQPERTKRIERKLFPDNFFKYPVHLQHCHKTNMTEGAVHAYCNAVLWQYHGR